MNSINTSYNMIIPRENATGEAVTQPDSNRTVERQNDVNEKKAVQSEPDKGNVVDQYA